MAPPTLSGLIVDLETLTGIPFFSWDPPTHSRSAVYDDVSVRGRSEPHPFYSHTDPQIWAFSIHLSASFNQNDFGTPAEVKIRENFIESLVMPDYGDEAGTFGVVNPPHLCRVVIGAMFDARGTLRNFSSAYRGPFENITGLPHNIDITFDLHVQSPPNVTPAGYSDVRLGLPRYL